MNNRVELVAERPIRVDQHVIVFLAADTEGELEVIVTPDLWEQLHEDAPAGSDRTEQQGFALAMIELAAAERTPGRTSAGKRVVLIG